MVHLIREMRSLLELYDYKAQPRKTWRRLRSYLGAKGHIRHDSVWYYGKERRKYD